MASFVPREPMPTALKALQAKVLKNRGLHYKFPYGVVFHTRPHTLLWRNKVPEPLYVGLTARGFFYAPLPVRDSYNILKMHYRFPYTNIYHECGAQIKGTALFFQHSGSGAFVIEGSDETNINIDIPGYYSVAVRIKSTTKFAMHFNEEEIGEIYIKKLFDTTWELHVDGQSHHLLSLHLSDELEANPNFPATYLGQRYYMNDPVIGVGSFWVMRCIVIDTAKPLVVYLLVDSGVQEPFFFPLTNVNVNDVITIYIRKTRGSWLVSTSFHPKTQRVDSSYGSFTNHIYPAVSSNALILQQFCEQGPP